MVLQQRKRSPSAAAKPPASANAIGDDTMLGAAYDLMLAVGPKRMTMADLARKAQVSRATLYRRWSNVGEVVTTLLTRELDALSAEALDTDAATARERLVGGIVRIAARVRAHPLLRKIIELDPELLTPYLLQRKGTSTEHQLALVEAALSIDADDPSLRAGDPRALAESVLLVTWSFVLTGPVLAGAEDVLDERLYDVLDRYLSP